MTTFAVTSVSSLFCQASTCLRIGSKLRCIRSTPTEMQSMSENDFECVASTGVKSPANAIVRAHENAIPAGHCQTHAFIVRVAQPDGEAALFHLGCEIEDAESFHAVRGDRILINCLGPRQVRAD
jgi:hypothetical protein